MKDITIIGRQHNDELIEVTIYDFTSITIFSDYSVDVTGEDEFSERGVYHLEFKYLPTLDVYNHENEDNEE